MAGQGRREGCQAQGAPHAMALPEDRGRPSLRPAAAPHAAAQPACHAPLPLAAVLKYSMRSWCQPAPNSPPTEFSRHPTPPAQGRGRASRSADARVCCLQLCRMHGKPSPQRLRPLSACSRPPGRPPTRVLHQQHAVQLQRRAVLASQEECDGIGCGWSGGGSRGVFCACCGARRGEAGSMLLKTCEPYLPPATMPSPPPAATPPVVYTQPLTTAWRGGGKQLAPGGQLRVGMTAVATGVAVPRGSGSEDTVPRAYVSWSSPAAALAGCRAQPSSSAAASRRAAGSARGRGGGQGGGGAALGGMEAGRRVWIGDWAAPAQPRVERCLVQAQAAREAAPRPRRATALWAALHASWWAWRDASNLQNREKLAGTKGGEEGSA